MNKKAFFFIFMLAIAVIVASEYFFLNELFDSQRYIVLFFTSIGLAGGIVVIISLFRKYN